MTDNIVSNDDIIRDVYEYVIRDVYEYVTNNKLTPTEALLFLILKTLQNKEQSEK